MADISKRDRYLDDRDRLAEANEAGLVSDAEYRYIIDFVDAHDENRRSRADKTAEENRTANTLINYLNSLRLAAIRMDVDLTEATARDFNDHTVACLNGRHEDISDDGLSKATLQIRESAYRAFVSFYDEAIPADADDIFKHRPDTEAVDPQDIFEPEDIQAIRDAVTNARDRCLVELLINTGQRVSAIRSIKLKDVQPHKGASGRITFSHQEGLKGAEGSRPLLGAKPAVVDWLDLHPAGDNPDAYLITKLPSHNGVGSHTEPLTEQHIRKRLRTIADRADVNKDVNPHQFRHAAATIWKTEQKMDKEDIKHLLGHSPHSNIFETTYLHIADDDASQAAESAHGFEVDDDGYTQTPDVCGTCSQPLPPDAKACSNCGTVFSPDAKAAQEEIDDMTMQGALQSAELTDEQREAIEGLDAIVRSNPEIAPDLLDTLTKD